MTREEAHNINPGDWVRFQRGGTLVIGEVRYVNRYQYNRAVLSIITAEHGSVDINAVVEVRPNSYAYLSAEVRL